MLEVVAIYRRFFADHNVGKIDFPPDEVNDSGESEFARLRTLEHCHDMLDRLERWVTNHWPEKREEIVKNLAFIQGCLWSLGVFCQDELEKHNRS